MISIQSTTYPFASVPVPVFSKEKQLSYPMQEAQLEIWLSSQQSPEASCAYNEIATLTLEGALDPASMEVAIQQVFQRHGSLRSVFDRQRLLVVEQSGMVLELEKHDWSCLTSDQVAQRRESLLNDLARRPFDLERGPLFRAILQRENQRVHHLTIAAHHLVLDGWSLNLVIKEMGRQYDLAVTTAERNASTAVATQSSAVPLTFENLPPAASYQQYVTSMQRHASSVAGIADLEYWKQQYADGIPKMELPATGKRGHLRSYRAKRYDHLIPTDCVARIRKTGAQQGCSLYNTVLAAFQGYLSRLCQSRDVLLAIPVAGQSAMDLPDLVGHCVHTLPLRLQVDSSWSMIDLLKQSRSRLLSAMDHQSCSYGSLLKHLPGQRDPSRPQFCNVSFNLDPVIIRKEIGFAGLSVTVKIERREYENFDWFVNGVIHEDQSIELQVQFNADLFEESYVAAYLQGFQGFMEHWIGNPSTPLAEVPLMSLSQRQQMIVDWNQTPLEYPLSSSLPAEFTRQADLTPDQIAVRCQGENLTYRELDQKSTEFAKQLSARGVVPGDLVGVCSTRNLSLLVQLLGVLKCGAGYVPLDPAYPTERLRHMCDDSGLKWVVAEESLRTKVEQFSTAILTFESLTGELPLSDQDLPEVATDQVCYVIYTSGSTGKPKGVMVPHGAVVNFLYSMKETPGYSSDQRVLAITTLSFDISVLELYLPLVFGGTVVLVDHETAGNGHRLISLLEEEQIRLMQATPATWRLMIGAGWSGKSDLKVLCGGEAMPADLVPQLLPRCQELWNMYGPTETTVWSACYRIESVDSPILIGRPIGNTQIFILDDHGQEVPVGVEGEVMIGGAGVTLGYLQRPDLTATRFTDNPYFNPFVGYINHRLYRTGDIACFRHDGNIEYRRRNDKQVKLRGYRIELGEIESAILSYPGIQQAMAIVWGEPPADQRLVAYLISDRDQQPDLVNDLQNHLRNHLRQHLPQYMIPQNFLFLENFPLTQNGKVDVLALPKPIGQSASVHLSQACHSASEKYLAQVWQQILNIEQVNLDDNFFDIGGHSLLVMQVINQVEEDTGIRLSPPEFLLGTLQQLALELDQPTEVHDNQAQREEIEPAITLPEQRPDPSTLRFKRLRNFWS